MRSAGCGVCRLHLRSETANEATKRLLLTSRPRHIPAIVQSTAMDRALDVHPDEPATPCDTFCNDRQIFVDATRLYAIAFMQTVKLRSTRGSQFCRGIARQSAHRHYGS